MANHRKTFDIITRLFPIFWAITISLCGQCFAEGDSDPTNTLLSSSILEHYDNGVELFVQDKYDDAIREFRYVINHAKTECWKSNAERWIAASEKKKQKPKRFSMVAKLGYQYNDYVPVLETSHQTSTTSDIGWIKYDSESKKIVPSIIPNSKDNYKKQDESDNNNLKDAVVYGVIKTTTVSDEKRIENKTDFIAIEHLYANYDFISGDNKKMGIGFTHYQSCHNSIREYDMIGRIFDIHFEYQLHPLFVVGFDYLPSYYYSNSYPYLKSQILRTELTSKFDDDLSTKFSYKYYDNDYYDDDHKDGHTNDVVMEFYFRFKPNYMLFGGIGYEDNAASDTASFTTQSYNGFKAKFGIVSKLPWEIDLGIVGELQKRNYSRISGSSSSDNRKDNEYQVSITVSRKFIYDWLRITTELSYTKNESGILAYEYDRLMVTQYVAVQF